MRFAIILAAVMVAACSTPAAADPTAAPSAGPTAAPAAVPTPEPTAAATEQVGDTGPALYLTPGDPGGIDFRGGSYTFAYEGCDWIEVAPVEGDAIPVADFDVPMNGAETLNVPAGPGYVNRSGHDCVVKITR